MNILFLFTTFESLVNTITFLKSFTFCKQQNCKMKMNIFCNFKMGFVYLERFKQFVHLNILYV